MEVFLSHGCTPSHHPFPDGIFPNKHPPAMGIPPSWNPRTMSRWCPGLGSHGAAIHLHWAPQHVDQENEGHHLEKLVGGPGPPLWKIWVRQLGWLATPNINGKIKLMATKPPTRYAAGIEPHLKIFRMSQLGGWYSMEKYKNDVPNQWWVGYDWLIFAFGFLGYIWPGDLRQNLGPLGSAKGSDIKLGETRPESASPSLALHD